MTPGPPIEDDELRSVFASESQERLDDLEARLLELERGDAGPDALDDALRQAHGMKGAARMLGQRDVERLAHHYEDLLSAAQREGRLEGAMAQRLFEGIDKLRAVVATSISLTGEPHGIDIDAELGRLAASTPSKAAESTEPATAVSQDVAETVAASTPSPRDEEQATGPPSSFEATEQRDGPDQKPGPRSKRGLDIDTVRIDTKRLDGLMNRAGELVVTGRRLGTIRNDLRGAVRRLAVARQRASAPMALSRGAVDTGTARGATVLDDGDHDADWQRLEAIDDALDSVTQQVESLADALDAEVQEARMIPIETVFKRLPRMARDLGRELGKQVELEIRGGETTADKQILERLIEPLIHIIRNAIDHGIEPPSVRRKVGKEETGRLSIVARRDASYLVVEVTDDGAGLDLDGLRAAAIATGRHDPAELDRLRLDEVARLALATGVSTKDDVTEVSGRGVGMDAALEQIEKLKGSIGIETSAGAGTTFTIRAPLTMSTARILVVEAGEQRFGIPLESVLSLRMLAEGEPYAVEGHPTVAHEDTPVPVGDLAMMLGGPGAAFDRGDPENALRRRLVLVESVVGLVGVIVDRIVDEQEVLLRPLGPPIRRLRPVAGAAMLASGDTCIVLHAGDLGAAVRGGRPAWTVQDGPAEQGAVGDEASRKTEGAFRVLVTDDSLTTRTQLARILRNTGYEVSTCADGLEAFQTLQRERFDALVTDVDMPVLDGFQLTERIRGDKGLEGLPVILVTTFSSEEHRRRGLDVGANAYITKGAFDQKDLLEALRRML